MFTEFLKVWDLQAQIIISYKINRVDGRMLCEVAFYGGLLGAKRKKKLLTADVKNFAVAPSHACFWKRTCNLAASVMSLF